MPNPFDPNSYGMPSFEDLMVGALTEEAARAKMEADESAMAAQLRRQARVRGQVMGVPAPDRLGDSGNPITPWTDNDPQLLRDLNLPPSGNPEPRMLQGPGGSVNMGPDIEAGQFGPKPGTFWYGDKLVDPRFESANKSWTSGALDLLSVSSVDLDDRVQETGWLPEDFNDEDGQRVTHAEAAARIADQLRTRRIREMGQWSPDYIAAQPKY